MSDFLVIVGPTASGKSAAALAAARKFGGELINCDSVQLYRGFNIGAAKASKTEQQEIPHHLLDVLNWDQEFTAGDFARAARRLIQDVCSRGKVPIVVGGSGLYLRALLGERFDNNPPKDDELRQRLDEHDNEKLEKLLRRLNPQRATEIHGNDRMRLLRAVELVFLKRRPVMPIVEEPADDFALKPYIAHIDVDRSQLHIRIDQRVDQMLKQGLMAEVQGLLAAGCPPTAKPMQSIGYKEVVQHLNGKISATELPEKIAAATRQYAKRQTTWFKKVPRHGEWLAFKN